MVENYVSRGQVAKKLNIHGLTVQNMRKRGDIEAVKVGNKFMYNLNKYLNDNMINNKNKKHMIYCRVSSKKQKEDLNRQIEFISKIYPNYEIITDIGSGLNFNRPGLQQILDYAIKGEIEEVVISYKDRLARFGYELIETIIQKYSRGYITIINKTEEKTPTEEMTDDIIAIMNVYVAKVNGLRKYKKKIRNTIKVSKS